MKTLKTVIAFIILNSTFTISSNAQIVYTDVNPDSTSSYGTPYYLDLNNDGINDFELYISHTPVVTHCTSCGNTNTYNSKTLILPLGSNSIGLNGGNSKLGLNTLIDSNALTWSNTSVTLISSSHSTSGSCYFGACIPSTTISGNWASGGTNKYLGLKINVGSQLYFGWIQLTVNSTSSFTAEDYAFTTVANQSILAGQTCSPQAAIIANGPLSFCSGGSVVLTSKNAGNTLKYQWKKNNVNISGATNKSYTATTAGDYKVKVTDTINNCSKTSGIKTITVPCRINPVTNNNLIANHKSAKEIINLSNHQKNNSNLNETENLRQASDSLDKLILKLMKRHHIPGLSAAVIKNGKVAWTKGYGYADIEKNIPFTPNTIHAEIASISKTVTATALMQLWEQGFFQLDDPINNYLPFTIENPYYPNIPITFRMLLNNTSSMAENGDVYIYNFDFNNTATEPLGNYVYDILNPNGALYADSLYFNNCPPGSQWNYSSFGFVLIGYLVEHISGVPFDQYSNTHIFQPLCMNHTGWFFSDVDTNIVSRPYYYDDDLADYVDFGLYEFPDYPDGQIKTTVTDLAKFMLMNINYGTLDGVKILDSATIALMRSNPVVDDSTSGESNGLGIFYLPGYCGADYWGHFGGDYGIATQMFFNPVNQTGLITFINVFEELAPGTCSTNDIFSLLASVADTITTVSQPDLNCSYISTPCEHSRTYWKNNSNLWALNSAPMKLGTTNFYNENQLLTLLNKSVNGNASIVLARQLIAAKLNVAQGSELSPIISTINAANNLIGNHHLPIHPNISFYSAQGISMLALAAQLDLYNHRFLNSDNCSVSGNREANEIDEPDDDIISNNALNISPNPFSQSTNISFTIEQPQNVSLKVIDVNGKLIKTLADNVFEEGEHQIKFNTEKLNAGIYFLKIQAGEFLKTEKLIITK